MDYRTTLPFFMEYQNQNIPYNGRNFYRGYQGKEIIKNNIKLYPFQANMDESQAMQDLDYLQEMYPADVKKYQRKISEILDKIDYKGSLIYDDYPDRLMLIKLADQIIVILKGEEKDTDNMEKWEWLGDMILILLFYEIYRRRRFADKNNF